MSLQSNRSPEEFANKIAESREVVRALHIVRSRRLTFPLSNLAALKDEEAALAETFLELAADNARTATCLRSSCGAVIVDNKGVVIGAGNNSLPGGCNPSFCLKEEGLIGPGFKSDRTCCTHAEVRAITNTLRAGGNTDGATIYFTRVDGFGTGRRVVSGQPYCTICSKFSLEVGIRFFVLEHDFGIVTYPTSIYNDLSFAYGRA